MCALSSIYRQAKIVNAFLITFTSLCLLFMKDNFLQCSKTVQLTETFSSMVLKKMLASFFSSQILKISMNFYEIFYFSEFFSTPKISISFSFLFLSPNFCMNQAMLRLLDARDKKVSFSQSVAISNSNFNVKQLQQGTLEGEVSLYC